MLYRYKKKFRLISILEILFVIFFRRKYPVLKKVSSEPFSPFEKRRESLWHQNFIEICGHKDTSCNPRAPVFADFGKKKF